MTYKRCVTNCSGNYNAEVTNCSGNYNAESKVKTLRLPRNRGERRGRTTIIPRVNILDSKDAAVCERHFPKDYPATMDYGKLRPCRLPSVFDCIKSSLLPYCSIFTKKNC